MEVSRRNFIRLSGVAAMSVTALGSAGRVLGQVLQDDGLYQIPFESTADPLTYLLKEHFEPFMGTVFRADAGDGRLTDMRLAAVTDRTTRINAKRGCTGESFSLLFESGSKKRMAAGLYTFDHENLGKFSLTLMPVGKSGRNFEAVINRIGR
jgi:hypothetical protein